MNTFNLIINLSALGDTVCTLPIVKHLYENNPFKYKYLIHTNHQDLFFFLEKDSLFSVGSPLFGGKVKTGWLSYPTSVSMHLVDYASMALGDTILDDRSYPEYPVDNIDVSGFNVDFKNSFMVTTNWTALNRRLSPEIINDIIDHILSIGLIPVVLGKNQDIPDGLKTLHSTTDNGINLHKTVNLLNKTTIKETIKIISLSRGIVGLDNGLLHLAGLTKVPIVCGFSNVRPKHRVPIRENLLGKDCYVVYPEGNSCRFCQSRFLNSYGVVFSKCDYGHYNCIKNLKSQMFIDKINSAVSGDIDDSKILLDIK